MIYIGIDPGKNGGIGFILTSSFVAYPFSEDTFLTEIEHIATTYDCRCILEQVHAMPGQGVTSMFNFGYNFGFIQGVLKSFNVPYETVTPQKWKKEFGVTSDKNTSIDVCKRLFPKINLKATERSRKDHDGMAEAMLMAEYGRRHYNAGN